MTNTFASRVHWLKVFVIASALQTFNAISLFDFKQSYELGETKNLKTSIFDMNSFQSFKIIVH